MVRCKKCGFKFPSFTQMNEVTFKTAVLTNSAEECPDCSETLAYSKRDYFFELSFGPVLSNKEKRYLILSWILSHIRNDDALIVIVRKLLVCIHGNCPQHCDMCMRIREIILRKQEP